MAVYGRSCVPILAQRQPMAEMNRQLTSGTKWRLAAVQHTQTGRASVCCWLYCQRTTASSSHYVRLICRTSPLSCKNYDEHCTVVGSSSGRPLFTSSSSYGNKQRPSQHSFRHFGTDGPPRWNVASKATAIKLIEEPNNKMYNLAYFAVGRGHFAYGKEELGGSLTQE